MKVLVIGSGGREHALAWKLARDPRVTQLLVAPGSAGIAEEAECLPVRADDLDGLVAVAAERGIDVTVVGPEAPLAAGVADRFRDAGLAIVGPGRDGAQLEASKAFAKEILAEAKAPTAAYRAFTSAGEARAFARELGFPCVVKADGLAAGKGVFICPDASSADGAIAALLERRVFGEAGRCVLVEQYLEGEEASFLALTDGKTIVPLAPSQDHKRLNDGDTGPNTGGMGAYSPAPILDETMSKRVVREILEPTVAALRGRGIDYRGVLYAGLMITDEGPYVLEYNVRFGDPECQPLMMRLEGSLCDLLTGCANGELDGLKPLWDPGTAVCVVMAAEGYPEKPRTGDVITGIEVAERDPNVKVFHAGTTRDDAGRWVTAGGRVLGVTARGTNIAEAIDRAYVAVDQIHWKGAHVRRDIGSRALARAVEAQQGGG